ncbi:MAG: polysaccharide deacetylase family sporulation protein PdaB [Candidatus Desulforudis sp.]|nr:polysaccharide deacetylase family sporulation protein PdaB [Desulforudis sp.]
MRFYYLSAKNLRRNLFLAALLVFTAATFYAILIRQPAAVSTTADHSAIVYQVKTKEKVAALTFDISWGEEVPKPVLDILKKEDIRCTFFLSGPWVSKHPEVAKRIAVDGHEVASHGWRHENYSSFSDEVIKEEIVKAHKVLVETTGRKPNLIRTPNGDWNERVVGAISESGYRAIQWSVDSLDWMDIGPAESSKRVLDRITPGAIILMHASDSAEQTPISLPNIIKGLKEKGYKLVTVSELLEYGRGVAE